MEGLKELLERKDLMNEQLARYGVRFGVYKDGVFHEQLFPFDPIPRVIKKDEFAWLEKGLQQRVRARQIHLFL